MAKKFRVTQYRENGQFSHDATYPFYFMAFISGWIHAGRSVGGERYYCVIREEEE